MSKKSLFVIGLEDNIRMAVRIASEQGTVGMSVENLRMVTRTPSPFLDGAPRGVNAQWAYANLFRETLSSMKFRNFQILN